MNTWRYLGVTLLALLCCGGLGGAAETDTLPLRVWSISQDSMDYIFMSTTPQRDGSPMLAFNHRSGRTSFLRVGDRLGDWSVDSFTPYTRTEKNPRTGMEKEIDVGRVSLLSEAGDVRQLEQGQLYPMPGYRAVLIDIASGRRFDVREGDRVEVGGETLEVGPVSSDTVAISAGSEAQSLPVISDDEVATLRQRIETATADARREAERLRKARERREAEDDWSQNVKIPVRPQKPPPKTFPTVPQYYFGTYGPIPVEYTILPPMFSRNGRMVRGAIIVPTRFETGPVHGFGNYCPATHSKTPYFHIKR